MYGAAETILRASLIPLVLEFVQRILGEQCGEDNQPDCSTKLKCFNIACHVCSAKGQLCGDNFPNCCDGYLCIDGRCKCLNMNDIYALESLGMINESAVVTIYYVTLKNVAMNIHVSMPSRI